MLKENKIWKGTREQGRLSREENKIWKGTREQGRLSREVLTGADT